MPRLCANVRGKQGCGYKLLLAVLVSLMINNSVAAAPAWRSASIPLTNDVLAMRAADLNRDGVVDLALLYRGGQLALSYSIGKGQVLQSKHFPVTLGTEVLALGDWNGNQQVDLALANYDTDVVTVLELGQDASPQILCETTVGRHPAALVFADIDGDERQEIVTANRGDGTASVIRYAPERPEGVSKHSLPLGTEPVAIDAADLNADGSADIIAADKGTNTITLLLSNAHLVAPAVMHYAVGRWPVAVALGDFNGDGHADIATANERDRTVSVLPGMGQGRFDSRRDYVTEEAPTALSAGDVNNDGYSELVIASIGCDRVRVLSGLLGKYAPDNERIAMAGHLHELTLADVDGDRQLDVMAAHGNGRYAQLLLSSSP